MVDGRRWQWFRWCQEVEPQSQLSHGQWLTVVTWVWVVLV